MAQPAMISKGDANGLTYVSDDPTCQVRETRDVLDVEIVSYYYGEHFSHPQHPEEGSLCWIQELFKTSQAYTWYVWESNAPGYEEPVEYPYFQCSFNHQSGYIKVTVGD